MVPCDEGELGGAGVGGSGKRGLNLTHPIHDSRGLNHSNGELGRDRLRQDVAAAAPTNILQRDVVIAGTQERPQGAGATDTVGTVADFVEVNDGAGVGCCSSILGGLAAGPALDQFFVAEPKLSLFSGGVAVNLIGKVETVFELVHGAPRPRHRGHSLLVRERKTVLEFGDEGAADEAKV